MAEDAQDGGGPRREFFRLFGHAIQNSMCIGSNGSYVFRHDIVGLQVCIFVIIIHDHGDIFNAE